MQVIQYVLAVMASVGGILASWYLSKKAIGWLQMYRTRVEQGEVKDARIGASHDDQRANDESDALKKVDGR